MPPNNINKQNQLSNHERQRLLTTGLLFGLILLASFASIGSIRHKLASFYNDRGLSEWEEGNLLEATTSFTRAIQLNPSFAEAHHNRGIVYYDQENLEDAISDYSKAIGLDNAYGEAYKNRGIALSDQAKLKEFIWDEFEIRDKAMVDLDKAIELNPNDAAAYLARGITKFASRDLDGAISDHTKAIELRSNYAKAYLQRGLVKSYGSGSPKDTEGAIADFNTALELGSTDPDIYYERGRTYLWVGDGAANALTDFDKSLELYPDDFRAYWGRGIAHYMEGNLEDSLVNYRLYLELNPQANNRHGVQQTIDAIEAELAKK